MSRNSIELRFSSPAVERARARMQERDRARHDGGTGRVNGNRVDLVVPLDEFNAGPVMISEELPMVWISDLVKDNNEVHWTATGPAKIELGLEVESAFVRIQGEAHFSLQHLCVRCGQRDVPFEVPLIVDLRLVERAPDKEINADYEGFNDGDDHAGLLLGDAADLEDVDIASYVGNSVDLAAVLREQLFLELPPHPNCESPGSTLDEPCLRSQDKLAVEKAHELVIDPRWAGLLAIKPLDDVPTGRSLPAPSVLKAAKKPATPATTVTAHAAKQATAKKPAKKAAAKKTAKKPAAKKPAKKAAAKKTAKKATAKKPAQKAAAKKPAKKAAAKKPAKKAAAKKPARKATKKAAATKKVSGPVRKKTPPRR